MILDSLFFVDLDRTSELKQYKAIVKHIAELVLKHRPRPSLSKVR